jgi:hypothetical protein
MIGEKVVVFLKNGSVLKGLTKDFSPAHGSFRVLRGKGKESSVAVDLSDCKAVFFVKDLAVDPAELAVSFVYEDSLQRSGCHLQIKFQDGQILEGTTYVSYVGRRGFFLQPCNPCSCTQKVFILKDALEYIVEHGPAEETLSAPPVL